MRGRGMGKGKHSGSRYGGATVILLLLLVAAFIYAFQSLGIYDILSKQVNNPATSAPATQRLSAVTTKPAASGTGASATGATTGATGASVTAGAKISEEIKMSSVTLYGVQVGVYSDLENAQTVSDQFRKDGSAGYLLKEDTLYRVIDSVYYSESDAKVVRDDFRKGKSPDACVIRIQANGVNWKVTASREQIDSIRNALIVFQNQIVALINTQKSLQQKQTSVDYAGTIKAVSEKLRDAEATLQRQVGATNSEMINKLYTCLKESASGLDKLQWSPDAEKTFETGIKYNIIDILLNVQNKIMG